MRRTVGIQELRADLTSILRRVSEEGEVVDVTKHGRAIARIVPVLQHAEAAEPLGATWSDLDRLAGEIERDWTPQATTAAEAVSEGRRG